MSVSGGIRAIKEGAPSEIARESCLRQVPSASFGAIWHLNREPRRLTLEVMGRSVTVLFASLALIALGILLLRPVALQALEMPYGTHHSSSVEIVKADGSQHCELLADCETVSFTTLGLDHAPPALVVLLVGLVTALVVPYVRRLHAWPVLVPNPPPLAPLG